MGKRELVALLNLSSWCLVMVERLFLAVPRGCPQFVIAVFPDHTHLLFMLSVPVALWGLRFFRSFRTPLVLTFMGGTLGVRLCPMSGSSDTSSWVKTELN